jgi:hypothetical protein
LAVLPTPYCPILSGLFSWLNHGPHTPCPASLHRAQIPTAVWKRSTTAEVIMQSSCSPARRLFVDCTCALHAWPPDDLFVKGRTDESWKITRELIRLLCGAVPIEVASDSGMGRLRHTGLLLTSQTAHSTVQHVWSCHSSTILQQHLDQKTLRRGPPTACQSKMHCYVERNFSV